MKRQYVKIAGLQSDLMIAIDLMRQYDYNDDLADYMENEFSDDFIALEILYILMDELHRFEAFLYEIGDEDASDKIYGVYSVLQENAKKQLNLKDSDFVGKGIERAKTLVFKVCGHKDVLLENADDLYGFRIVPIRDGFHMFAILDIARENNLHLAILDVNDEKIVLDFDILEGAIFADSGQYVTLDHIAHFDNLVILVRYDTGDLDCDNPFFVALLKHNAYNENNDKIENRYNDYISERLEYDKDRENEHVIQKLRSFAGFSPYNGFGETLFEDWRKTAELLTEEGYHYIDPDFVRYLEDYPYLADFTVYVYWHGYVLLTGNDDFADSEGFYTVYEKAMEAPDLYDEYAESLESWIFSDMERFSDIPVLDVLEDTCEMAKTDFDEAEAWFLSRLVYSEHFIQSERYIDDKDAMTEFWQFITLLLENANCTKKVRNFEDWLDCAIPYFVEKTSDSADSVIIVSGAYNPEMILERHFDVIEKWQYFDALTNILPENDKMEHIMFYIDLFESVWYDNDRFVQYDQLGDLVIAHADCIESDDNDDFVEFWTIREDCM